jgi:hypothetical protein
MDASGGKPAAFLSAASVSSNTQWERLDRLRPEIRERRHALGCTGGELSARLTLKTWDNSLRVVLVVPIACSAARDRAGLAAAEGFCKHWPAVVRR